MSDPRSFMGRYVLVSELGAGGMGAVYRARDPKLGRDVAIKVLGDSAQVSSAERFQREARALAQLAHPGITQVYDFGALPDGRPYLVSEFIDGVSLIDRLRQGPLDPDQARSVFRKLAQALVHAHERGVLHRDIKPHNIMLRSEKEPVLLDFGLAQVRLREGERALTQEGTVLGTPAYMSPEQGNGEAIDGRTDVYSFGATLYHALTGSAPFAGSSTYAIMKKVFLEPPEDPRALAPTIPSDLTRLCLRCLAKEPDRRPQDFKAVLASLKRRSAPRRRLAPALGMLTLALIAAAVWWLRIPEEFSVEISGGDTDTKVLEGDLVLGRFDERGRFSLRRPAGRYRLTLERKAVREAIEVEVGAGEAQSLPLDLTAALELRGKADWKASLFDDKGQPAPADEPIRDRPLPIEVRLPMGPYRLVLRGQDPLSGPQREERAWLARPGESLLLKRPRSIRITLDKAIVQPPFYVDADGDQVKDLVVIKPEPGNGPGNALAYSSADGRELWHRKSKLGHHRRPILEPGSSYIVVSEESADGLARTCWLDPRSGEDVFRLEDRAFLSSRSGFWTGPVPLAGIDLGGESPTMIGMGWSAALPAAQSRLTIWAFDRKARSRVVAQVDRWSLGFSPPLVVDGDGDGRRDDLLVRVGRKTPLMQLYTDLATAEQPSKPGMEFRLRGAAAGLLEPSHVSPNGQKVALAYDEGERLGIGVLDLPSNRDLGTVRASKRLQNWMVWIDDETLILASSSRKASSARSKFLRLADGVGRGDQILGVNIEALRPLRRSGQPSLLLAVLCRPDGRRRIAVLDPRSGFAELWNSLSFKGKLFVDGADLDGDGNDEVVAWSARKWVIIAPAPELDGP